MASFGMPFLRLAGAISRMTITRTLSNPERHKYASHLKRLSPSDRYLRFGYTINDELIDRYVANQDTSLSSIIGVFDSSLDVVAAIEIVYDRSKYLLDNKVAEVGLSVEAEQRGKGLGSSLFSIALSRARNRGVKTMTSQCLSQNRFMMLIARKHGMMVHTESGESFGELHLGKCDATSAISELVGEGMGMWDYALHAAMKPLRFKIPPTLGFIRSF
jgi:GNAT superfamily N-acetyltransferase